ncbi:MAG: hypothetical protein H6622_17990 [Halobacteriovoraceae bacterium]|nr:hypothetical protein [Halobacteriovoraceae bacterium]
METANTKWIMGSNSVPRIALIDSKWKKTSKKNSIKELLKDTNISKYEKLILDKPILKKLKNFLNDGEKPFGKVGVDGKFIEINEDILKTNPNIQNEFIKSKDLLFKTSSWITGIEDIVVSEIVPLTLTTDSYKAGFSSRVVEGLIFYAFPLKADFKTVIDFAIDYAHEIGHQVLFRYQMASDVFENNFHEKLVYSSIKGTKRPAIMVFHALFALSYMKVVSAEIFKYGEISTQQRKYTLQIYNDVCSMLDETLGAMVSEVPSFTKMGKILFNEISMIKNINYHLNEGETLC